MKTITKIVAPLAIAALLAGCAKEEANKPTVYSVQSYERVEVDGNAKVMFVEENSTYMRNNVYISAGTHHAEKVSVESMGGVLYINVDDDVRFEDGLVFTMVREDHVDEIRLTGGHHAVFDGPFDVDLLDVETGGNSTLVLSGLRVGRLNCRTTGSSDVTVSTYAEAHVGPVIYPETRVVKIDDRTILVDGVYIVYGDAVVLDNGSWTVQGNNIIYQYRIGMCDFETVGSSNIHAANALTVDANLRLVGSSQAEIFAFNDIKGEGKGTSELYYVNVPGVNTSGYSMVGSAEIIPMPWPWP